MTTHLDEVRPGLGGIDYKYDLEEINKLNPDATLMLEHLPGEQEYDLAAAYLRSQAPAGTL
jgi:hypothetical protein